jgi:hypothetical protein
MVANAHAEIDTAQHRFGSTSGMVLAADPRIYKQYVLRLCYL